MKASSSIIICNRFRLDGKIGGGAFGEVFAAYDRSTHRNVAVKLEKRTCQYPQLHYEYVVLNDIFHRRSIASVPEPLYYNTDGDFNVLVMERLGYSLADYLRFCNGRFDEKTVLMLGIRIVRLLELIHDAHYVHRDIKPENLLFGLDSRRHDLLLIDFGLSKCLEQTTQRCEENQAKTGTPRFVSLNVHRGLRQNRRDDIEAVAYMLIFFIRGTLPWIQLETKQIGAAATASAPEDKFAAIGRRKAEISIQELCQDIPSSITFMLVHSRSLEFNQKPNYDEMVSKFAQSLERRGLNDDGSFCWKQKIARLS